MTEARCFLETLDGDTSDTHVDDRLIPPRPDRLVDRAGFRALLGIDSELRELRVDVDSGYLGHCFRILRPLSNGCKYRGRR